MKRVVFVCVCGALMVTAKRAGCWHTQSSNHTQYPLVETNSEHKRHGGRWTGGGGGGVVGGRLIFLNLFIITPSANVVQSSVELFLNTWRTENKIRSCAVHIYATWHSRPQQEHSSKRNGTIIIKREKSKEAAAAAAKKN